MNESFRNKVRRTKDKVFHHARKFAPMVPWLVTFSTVFAAWNGHIKSEQNSKRIDHLEEFEKEATRVVNHNADNNNYYHQQFDNLKERHRELFDEAKSITEGKEAESA